MNEQTLIYNLHYLLGRPATQALIASPTRWNVAYTPELVQDDNLPLRLRFYELDPETNEPTLTRYPADTLFALTGKQKGALETGDTLFTCLEFTETEVTEDIEGTPTVTDLYYEGTLNLNTVPLDAAFAANEIITALVDLKVYTEDPDQSQTIAQSPFRLLHQAHADGPIPDDTDTWGHPSTYLRTNETGQLVGPLIPRSGTKAEIDQVVLALGETAYYTNIRGHAVGDGTTAGGWPEIIFELDSDVEVDSDAITYVIDQSLPTPAFSVWEVTGQAALEMVAAIDDPANFRVELNATSYGDASHPSNDAGTVTAAYESGAGSGFGLGGFSIVPLSGILSSQNTTTTFRLSLKQLSTDALNPIKALAGKTYLRVRRVL